MIPRRGQVNQHHFGHEAGGTCTPAKVTHAALRRWLVLALRRALAERQAVPFTRLCRNCNKVHNGDLLAHVAQIIENVPYGNTMADALLLDGNGELCAAILIDDLRRKTIQTLNRFAEVPTPTLLITLMNTEGELREVIQKARVVGGTCDLIQSQTQAITDPALIREVLCETVARWPGYFYGALETVEGLPFILRVKDHHLWLTPDLWRKAIGGMRNPISSEVQIMVQTWPHDDGGAIWLYYVVVRDSQAVAVKRFAPGQTPTAEIDERFRHSAITAVDLARHLVMQKL